MVKKVVAVIGAGAMGSGVGRRLVENGLRVITPLDGRSAATKARAEAAGMSSVGFEGLLEAELILSIVPPGQALDTARRCAALLAAAPGKPGYADCNAVSPATTALIDDLISKAGAPFIDAGIIGGPPVLGSAGPVFYASGPAAETLAALTAFGLRVSVLDQPIGAASALKMSYAGIGKGFTALAAMMALAATRAGVADALRAELEASQPQLLQWLIRASPAMCPKAYRWVAEMEEIGAFASADPAAKDSFDAIAAFYRHIADDVAGDGADATRITDLYRVKPAS